VVTHGGIISATHLLATGLSPPAKIVNCGTYTLRVATGVGRHWEIDSLAWQRNAYAYLKHVGFQQCAFGGGSKTG
jgi:hypothetical protein